MVIRVIAAAVLSIWSAAAQFPILNDYTNSAATRWLKKPVLRSKMLDDAETLDSWKIVNADQAKGELSVTRERAISGAASVRLRCPTAGDKPIPNARYYGTASARRIVDNKDWSEWNRLSFWIYPDLPGFRVVSMMLLFHNEGKEPVPDSYGKMGRNYLILKNHEWNHIVWEIANLARDKVTGLDFAYRMQGHEPGAADIATFDIDKVELQQVDADHFEGWDVAPGRIAFSHSGYQAGSPKTAMASDLKAKEFELVDAHRGKVALAKPVKEVKSAIGSFQVMDFSEVRDPGTYILRANGRSTQPFRIGDDVWKSSLWKAINFFYVERCGFPVPEVHDACHRDWLLQHDGRQIVVNGGWHDAGDLSQSFSNTAEAAYAMFSLAERMQARNEDPELLSRLLEEARWGLDWLLKTTFHDGFRPTFSLMDRWTDGIIGDLDDMTAQATNTPASNLAAAATEAIAARVLRRSDPVTAGHSLRQAEEDWRFALAGMAERPGASVTELYGHGILAALELWLATHDRQYAEQAFQWAETIISSQQRSFLPGLTVRLTGFFYTGPDKRQILRYSHISHEEAPVVALVRLCQLFPDNPNWIQWYAAVTLYSEYFHKTMAKFTEPYGMLANSVFKDDEYLAISEGSAKGATRDSFRDQVLSGIPVGGHYYVRRFPVWFALRGNNGTMLAADKAFAAAAHLRGSVELAALAERNLQWVVGRNPFGESLMWGEGYDYAPQFSTMSGDIVGSLPVGIQTHRNADQPYWPTENCHNWKEVWVHPVGRWIWLMRDLAGPAHIEGPSRMPVEFREVSTGKIARFIPEAKSGTFQGALPEGEYEVSAGGRRRRMTVLPGESYKIDLARDVDLELSQAAGNGEVAIRASVSGSGTHKLLLRADNLSVEQPEKTVLLRPGAPQKLEWHARINSADTPWVGVVIPDGDPAQGRELVSK